MQGVEFGEFSMDCMLCLSRVQKVFQAKIAAIELTQNQMEREPNSRNFLHWNFWHTLDVFQAAVGPIKCHEQGTFRLCFAFGQG